MGRGNRQMVGEVTEIKVNNFGGENGCIQSRQIMNNIIEFEWLHGNNEFPF
jgi:hypothetical protein